MRGCGGRPRARRRGRVGEERGDEAAPGEDGVALDDQREAAWRRVEDERELPQRPRAVQAGRKDPRRDALERVHAARKCLAADVEGELEIGRAGPHRASRAKRRPEHARKMPWEAAQTLSDELGELFEGGRTAFEEEHAADVLRRSGAFFEGEQRGVGRRQAVVAGVPGAAAVS